MRSFRASLACRGSGRVGACLCLLASCGGDEATGPSAGAGPDSPGSPGAQVWLRECAAESGVDFVHRSGHAQEFYTPEVVGGGVALLDADGDGRLDLYLVQSGSLLAEAGSGDAPVGNRLYHNRGAGAFEDVSEASGAGDPSYGIGVATGDCDNDGDPDLYVTNVGPNVLLANRGDGTFEDVSAPAGVADPGFGSSAAFLDADADGDLDLYVANYLIWSAESERDCFNGLGQRDYCAPAVYNAPAVDVLYENDGRGVFRDVSREAGLGTAFGTGLGVVCGDFTGDGRVDVFVANDGRPDQLWVNLGGLRFEDRALALGCAIDQDGQAKAGMGVSAADLDDDGDLDLLVCNLRGESDSLFLNQGGSFRDFTALSGLGAIGRGFTRFGVGWVDLDADGWLDLYQANGRVAHEADVASAADPLAEPNLLYRGGPGGRFAEVSPRGGTLPLLVHASRGAAFGDLDGDGGIDLVVNNRDAAPYVLRNVRAPRGHWLLVRVLEEHGRDALGATLTLRAGPRTLRRDVRTAYSYAAASDPRVHFGLGDCTEVESLVVRWVDGVEERFEVPGVDRVLELRRRGPVPAPR